MTISDPDAPTVTLGGRSFSIPQLAPRQMRHIRSQLMELNARLSAYATEGRPGALTNLSNDDYESLMLKVVWRALTRASDITYEDFTDLPFTEGELSDAWVTVRDQSGLFVIKIGQEGGGSAPAGESQADQPQIGTGTAS